MDSCRLFWPWTPLSRKCSELTKGEADMGNVARCRSVIALLGTIALLVASLASAAAVSA